MRKAISYFLIFLGIQICVGAACAAIANACNENLEGSALTLIVASVITSIVTIGVFLLTRWTEVSPRWLRTRQWWVLLWSVVASIGCIVPSTWLQEQMPELPNLLESDFDMILQNRWGYLAIGMLAPLAEEIVFRGAILRSLLCSSRFSALTAVVLSAVLFAVIHFNPAQMPHAFLVGLLLGWMYYRTGSILPGLAYHWANNSFAYLFYNIYPDPDLKLADLFGGSQQHVLMAVGFSLFILLPALYQLHLWMRRAVADSQEHSHT